MKEKSTVKEKKLFSIIEHVYCLSMSALFLVCCVKLWTCYKYENFMSSICFDYDNVYGEPTSPIMDYTTI